MPGSSVSGSTILRPAALPPSFRPADPITRRLSGFDENRLSPVSIAEIDIWHLTCSLLIIGSVSSV